MAVTLPLLPAKTPTAKTSISLFPENPKTLILEQCKTIRDLNEIHAHLIKTRLLLKPKVAENLLESAAILLPTSMDYAVSIFRQIDEPDSPAYNIMIRGFTLKQSPHEAILLFKEMHENSVQPDEFTFPCILKVCSRLQALSEGEQIHALIMKCGFGSHGFVKNTLIHMYANCGEVEVARRVFDEMSERNVRTWNSMFAGYTKSGNWEEVVKLYVEEKGLKGNPTLITSLVDIQASRCREALDLFHEMQKANIDPNEITMVSILSSCAVLGALETGKWVHFFIKKKRMKLTSEEIYNAIEDMMKQIKSAGYVPNTAEARLDAEEDDKESSVSHHSEKLAIAFGLIKSPPGTTIRITKNLRVCTDCHNATKLVSKVFNREIVVRDRTRFHHFKEGSCSCNDYW
ncbi:unnamed protein product, partial [Vitis vinifera]